VRDTRSGKGLSMAKLGVLGRLYRNGTTTPTALAAYLRIQPQSLTRLLADLQRRKLITRRPDEADRRQSLLELTPAEQELLRIAAGLMDRLAAAAGVQAVTRPILVETSYTAYAAVMTPLVILLLDFGQAPSWSAGVDRFAATLAGCGLALTLGYLGWPRLSPPARLPVRSKTAPPMKNALNTPGTC
jgi:DNA-binding MarR family transcriptional regulator